MHDRIQKLEKEIKAIQLRNSRVEEEKAWEVSGFRVVSIAGITYGIAAAILYSIGVKDFLLSAFVPAIGYVLSTRSLPFVKTWWLKRRHT